MSSVKYRLESDGKYHVDIDDTGRFGLQFSSIPEIREAVKMDYTLEEVFYKLFKFDIVHSRLSKKTYPLWRIYTNTDGEEIPKTGWIYGYLCSTLPYLEDY